jgi:hypothetical protein
MFVAQTRKRTNEERRRMEFLKIHILHQDGVAALRNHHWIPGRVVSQQLAAAVGSREPAFFFDPRSSASWPTHPLREHLAAE